MFRQQHTGPPKPAAHQASAQAPEQFGQGTSPGQLQADSGVAGSWHDPMRIDQRIIEPDQALIML